MGLSVGGGDYLRWAYLLTSLNVSSGMGLSAGEGERAVSAGGYLRNSTVCVAKIFICVVKNVIAAKEKENNEIDGHILEPLATTIHPLLKLLKS